MNQYGTRNNDYADRKLDELLNAQSEVLKLPSSPNRVKTVLTKYLKHHECLVGLGEKPYLEHQKELVELRPAKGEDRLSQFLRNHCGWLMKVMSRARVSQACNCANTR